MKGSGTAFIRFLAHALSGSPAMRLSSIAATVALALAGVVFISQLAIGLKAGRAQTVPVIGRLEHVRLPVGARHLDTIQTFEITMPGAEDYGRVFVNNYVVLSNERPDLTFYEQPKGFTPENTQHSVNRKDLRLGAANVRPHLLRHQNYVIAELENAFLGCSSNIDIVVNGIRLEHFPQIPLDHSYVEPEAVNSELKSRFEFVTGNGIKHSVCSRRIWEFYLY